MKLNNSEEIYKFDTGLVAKSIEALPKQIKQLLNQENEIDIKINHKIVNKIVVNGMGGSNLGSRIIKSVFKNQLSVPIIIEPGYVVPEYVDENTLYIMSSYSGNTEEVLSVYDKVKEKKAQILIITAKSDDNGLINLMKQDDISGYIFDPQNNPSNQPRLGVGYSIFGIIFMLKKTGLINIENQEIKDIINNLNENNNYLKAETNTEQNKAKQIAELLYNKKIVLIGSEFLEGNLHTARNQFFENSKNFTVYFSLPELNHYLLEGLSFPENNPKDLIFLFIDSKFYSPAISKRSKLTKQVIEKNGIKTISHNLTSDTKLEQSFEMLQLMAWITFYLSVLNNTNPSLIPWVDWFKKELA